MALAGVVAMTLVELCTRPAESRGELTSKPAGPGGIGDRGATSARNEKDGQRQCPNAQRNAR